MLNWTGNCVRKGCVRCAWMQRWTLCFCRVVILSAATTVHLGWATAPSAVNESKEPSRPSYAKSYLPIGKHWCYNSSKCVQVLMLQGCLCLGFCSRISQVEFPFWLEPFVIRFYAITIFSLQLTPLLTIGKFLNLWLCVVITWYFILKKVLCG